MERFPDRVADGRTGSILMGHHSHTIRGGKGWLLLLLSLAPLSLLGCHDWPDERVTALEAQEILREVSKIRPVPDPNRAVPDIYKSAPQKLKHTVGGLEDWKIVYYCKYQTAETLEKMIDDQFSNTIFDSEGKSKTVPKYSVASNMGTNQLIVGCPSEQDGDAILAVLEAIDVAPIQIRIECMVSEIYSDLTVDRETSLQIQNLFGEGITLSGPQGAATPAFPGASIRDSTRSTFGLNVGVSQGDEGHLFQALVDILVSRGYLKILMNPTLTVANGQTSRIMSKQHLPLQEVTYEYTGGLDYLKTETEYYDIIDSLEITPHAYADGTIGLETTVQLASHLTPEGIDQVPIVTERTVTNKENRIRAGESLIIGGLRKTEKRDVVRGTPILKDIPGIGMLFSGRDFEERATETLFILTPTISGGGVPNAEMVEMLKQKHTSPMTQSLPEQIMDPLGIRAREMEIENNPDSARDPGQEEAEEKDATGETPAPKDKEDTTGSQPN